MGGFDALAGSGELQLRIESLEAERLRPVPPPPLYDLTAAASADTIQRLVEAVAEDEHEAIYEDVSNNR